jgi:cytochrome c-type biogenesis protein
VIVEILTTLSSLMTSNPVWMILGAFLWGLASVLLSPCHLGSIPLVMGFVSQGNKDSTHTNKKENTQRAFWQATIFSLGILVVMILIGFITASLGRMLGDLGMISNVLGAIIFLIVGLLLLDIIHLPQASFHHFEFFKSGSYWSIFVLGILFGTVLGPCAFAFLMPVLSVVFVQIESNPWLAWSLLFAYAIGHSVLIVVAGTATGWVQKYSTLNNNTSIVSILRKLSAVVCIAVAIWFGVKII